jgi:hypothetical protein
MPLMRFLKAFLLSIPLAFLLNAILMLLVALLVWEAPSARDLGGWFFFDIPWHDLAEKPAELVPLIFFWGMAFLQACVLTVPLAPELTLAEQPAALWPRVLAGAFVTAFLVALPLLALVDVYYYLPGANPSTFEPGRFILGALAAWAISWFVWIPILLRRTREDPAALETSVLRTSKATLVGMALCLPWYLVLRRKQSCACSLGSFVALLMGLWSLLLVGGPLLLVLARDRRLRGAVEPR